MLFCKARPVWLIQQHISNTGASESGAQRNILREIKSIRKRLNIIHVFTFHLYAHYVTDMSSRLTIDAVLIALTKKWDNWLGNWPADGLILDWSVKPQGMSAARFETRTIRGLPQNQKERRWVCECFGPAAEPEANFHQYSHVLTTVSSVVRSCHISSIYIKQAKSLEWAQTTRSDGPPPRIRPAVSLPLERETTNKWVTPAGLRHAGCKAVSWRAWTIATPTNLLSLMWHFFPVINCFFLFLSHASGSCLYLETSCQSNYFLQSATQIIHIVV